MDNQEYAHMHMCHVCVVVYRHIYWSLKLLYYFLCSILCFTNKNLTHVHLFNQMLIFCLFIFQTFSFLKNQNKKPTHVHQPPSPVHHHFNGSTKKRSPTLSSVIHYCRQVHTSAGQPVTQKKKKTPTHLHRSPPTNNPSKIYQILNPKLVQVSV